MFSISVLTSNLLCKSDSQPWVKNVFQKNSCGHFLLQAGTYVISSPYMIRFHTRGGAKNKNHFLGILGPKKSIFGQKIEFLNFGVFHIFT